MASLITAWYSSAKKAICCSCGDDSSPGKGEDRSDEPLIVYPIPRGSMVNIYKQDPSIKEVGHRAYWIPMDIRSGPSSDDISIEGIPTVTATDAENNFLYNPTTHPQDFDAVSTFTIVNQILTMFRRGLKKMKYSDKLEWEWGSSPTLKVYPHAGNDSNAYYDRESKSLQFFYFKGVSGKTIYTCRSYDIVSHESGHAILDAIKPSYYFSQDAQTNAFHESFADLTAIFGMLDQLDMCDSIIALSKGDLHSDNFFSQIGEQFGEGLGMQMGIRNCDQNFAIDEVSDNPHDLSVVFTGAIYDTIVELFEVTRDLKKYSPAESLFKVGKHMNAVVVAGVTKAPNDSPSFADIATSIMAVEYNEGYKEIMKKHFDKRKIFDPNARPKSEHHIALMTPGAFVCGSIVRRKPTAVSKSDAETEHSPILEKNGTEQVPLVEKSETEQTLVEKGETTQQTIIPTEQVTLVSTDETKEEVKEGKSVTDETQEQGVTEQTTLAEEKETEQTPLIEKNGTTSVTDDGLKIEQISVEAK